MAKRQWLQCMRFVCVHWEDAGWNGWVPEHKPYFDPADGGQVAHDILEEFPYGEDQPHDEFMALGASVWGRGRMGYLWDRVQIPLSQQHVNLGNSFFSTIKHAFEDDSDRTYELRWPPKTTKLKDWRVEEHLALTREFVRAQFRDFRETCLKYGDEDSDEYWLANDENYETVVKYIDAALDWIRIGYRRAAKRYRKIDEWDLTFLLFRVIERRASELLKEAEPGDILTVNVNLRHREVKFHLETPFVHSIMPIIREY